MDRGRTGDKLSVTTERLDFPDAPRAGVPMAEDTLAAVDIVMGEVIDLDQDPYDEVIATPPQEPDSGVQTVVTTTKRDHAGDVPKPSTEPKAAATTVAGDTSGRATSSERRANSTKHSANRTAADPSGRPCYRCGKPGHMKRECKEPRPQRDLTNLVCRRCGGKGHFARNCPSDPKKADKRQEPDPKPSDTEPKPDQGSKNGEPKGQKDEHQTYNMPGPKPVEEVDPLAPVTEDWRFSRKISMTGCDVREILKYLAAWFLVASICLFAVCFAEGGGVGGGTVLWFLRLTVLLDVYVCGLVFFSVVQPIYCFVMNQSKQCAIPKYEPVMIPWMVRFFGGRLHYEFIDWLDMDWKGDMRTDRTRIGELRHDDPLLCRMRVSVTWFGVAFGWRHIVCSSELMSQLMDASATNEYDRSVVYQRMQRIANSSFSINIPRHKLLLVSVHAGSLEVAFSAYLAHRELLEAMPGFHRGAPLW